MHYSGIVIHGLQNGRKFGFPTANVALTSEDNMPEKGVYAVNVSIEEKSYQGMLYAGTRPTLHLTSISIEIYIFDFDQDIYDKPLSFELLQKIRDERKFDTIEDLIQQIKHDQDNVLHFFTH